MKDFLSCFKKRSESFKKELFPKLREDVCATNTDGNFEAVGSLAKTRFGKRIVLSQMAKPVDPFLKIRFAKRSP